MPPTTYRYAVKTENFTDPAKPKTKTYQADAVEVCDAFVQFLDAGGSVVAMVRQVDVLSVTRSDDGEDPVTSGA